jgi:hypothetical protein
VRWGKYDGETVAQHGGSFEIHNMILVLDVISRGAKMHCRRLPLRTVPFTGVGSGEQDGEGGGGCLRGSGIQSFKR